MANEKVNVALVLSGTATAVKPDTSAKSRKGYEIGRSKVHKDISFTGVSYQELHKRLDGAVALLQTGKAGKGGVDLEKKLKDAEAQIEDLVTKLDQVTGELDELKKSQK